MNLFATHFREKVQPDLLRLCQQEAVPVAWETKSFTEGWSVVMREARRLGADHLPEHLYDELDLWVCKTISDGVAREMPRVTKVWEIIERAKTARRAIRRLEGKQEAADNLVSACVDGALSALG